MNRKDFIKSLLAGIAIAPALLKAEAADPAQHLVDIEELSAVPYAFEFNCDGFMIDRTSFDWIQISCSVGTETSLEGADLWTYGIARSRFKEIERLFYDPRPHQCIARIKLVDGRIDVLAFTGYLSFFQQSGQYDHEPTMDVRWCMTRPATEVTEL
jgi:hypothetical protein